MRAPALSIRYAALLVALACLLAGGCAEGRGRMAAYRGLKALERGSFQRAASLLQHAVNRTAEPEREAVLLNHMGVALARIGRYDEAFAAFELAWHIQPHLPDPAYNLGVLYLEQGLVDRSEEWFQRAADLDPEDTRALEFLSAIRRRRRDWDQARVFLEEALRRRPLSARINTARGLVELQAGHPQRAAAILRQCIEQDPDYAPAVFNLAMACREQDDLMQARSLFHEYTRMADITPLHLEMAREALREINLELAAPEAAPPPTPRPPAPPPAPPSPEVLMRTAGRLLQQQRLEAAVNNYLLAARAARKSGQTQLEQEAEKLAARAAGEDAHARHALGMYLLELKRPADALEHFKQAAAFDPQWFDAHRVLAQTALDQGEYDAALVALRSAVRLRPEDPNALWSLVQVFDRTLKLREPARRYYNLFIERFPDDVRADVARRRLEALVDPAPEY